MERKNSIKNPWYRITAMLLLVCLMTILLWGCYGGRFGLQIPKQTEIQETAPKSELLDTMPKAVAYVEEMVQREAEEFSLVCTEEIYNAMMRTTYETEKGERKAYFSMLEQAGIYDFRATTAGLKKTITVYVKGLYPGYEILHSIAAGKEDKLPSKLKKTLAEARAIADSCRTEDPLETAEKIQSVICSRIRYSYMTNMSDVDTAVSALLNGTADCDGYADAFYLIGTLAGLEVRYQQGITSTYDLEENIIVTASHMWNLLKLDGSWRVVDVCWADQEDFIDYTWFNIGKDRASRSRVWEEEMTVPLLETTDLSTRPETEYSVTSREVLENAIKEAAEKDQRIFTIIYDRKEYGSRKEAFDVLRTYYNGEFVYYWDEGTKSLTIVLTENWVQTKV